MSPNDLRHAVTLATRRDESTWLAAELQRAAPKKNAVAEHARQLIGAVREQSSSAGDRTNATATGGNANLMTLMP